MTTTAIALVKEMAEPVKPPRALAVPFPYGYALGRPEDPDYQHQVLAAALGLLERNDTPVMAELSDDPGRPVQLLQATDVVGDGTPPVRDAATDVTRLRTFYERWADEHAGRTAVGLSRIPQRRFRGVVRFLEAYARGEETDLPERPADVSLGQFVRYCVDDLKAFAYEARMSQRPAATEEELHRWFWGKTGLGALCKAVADHMIATDDPDLKAIAFGIAR